MDLTTVMTVSMSMVFGKKFVNVCTFNPQFGLSLRLEMICQTTLFLTTTLTAKVQQIAVRKLAF